MGYAAGLSALLCATQARDVARVGLMVWLGVLLAGSLLISTFAALMFTAMATVYLAVRLIVERRYRAMVPLALAAAAPLAIGWYVALKLQYVDEAESLVQLGLNPAAATRLLPSMVLSFGPMLFAGLGGLWVATRRNAPYADVFGVIIGVSVLFYFFVDVKDHQHVYVGWRSGHFMFFAFAGLAGYLLQELMRSARRVRVTAIAVAIVMALAAAPTFAIDFYNTQDVANRSQGPGFRWTLILTPDEIQAIEWIRLFTPRDAIVQVEPSVRNSATWAYIPAFAERRMAAAFRFRWCRSRNTRPPAGGSPRLYKATSAASRLPAGEGSADRLPGGWPARTAGLSGLRGDGGGSAAPVSAGDRERKRCGLPRGRLSDARGIPLSR